MVPAEGGGGAGDDLEADLARARACLAGDPEALRALDRMLDEVAVPAAASRGLGRAEIDEVIQQVRVRLLVGGPDAAPGLAGYSGRGPLAGFVRSTAMRVALNLRRDEGRRQVHPVDALVADAAQDPELGHMKDVYLEEFRRSLAAAWAALDAEEQLFLRHQLEDRLTIDDLARTYGMHRSTAARRLVGAREKLAEETRRNLRRVLGLGEVDVESVLRLIRSRLGDATGALG